jgi:NUMOD4 motif/HNH endonuclease
MDEVWVPVKGYEGVIEVSNIGRVRTLNRESPLNGGTRLVKGQIANLQLKKNGYLQVAVRTPGKRKWFLVHRLVAQAFIPNLEGLPQVNHIDANKQNNNASNLEWTNAAENQNHAVKFGLTSNEEDHYKAKLTREQVLEIREMSGLHIDIAEKFGVNRSTVTCIKAKKTWKYV